MELFGKLSPLQLDFHSFESLNQQTTRYISMLQQFNCFTQSGTTDLHYKRELLLKRDFELKSEIKVLCRFSWQFQLVLNEAITGPYRGHCGRPHM